MDSWQNLDQAFAELEAECADIVRGLTVRVWSGILSKTPQWAGRMVASYNYSLNAPNYVDRSGVFEGRVPEPWGDSDASPRYPGHSEAIYVANTENFGNDRAFKLGDTVYITNGVDHGEGPYSQAVEDEAVRLRSPGRMASRTLDWARVNYASISRIAGQTLRSYEIGG